MNTISILTLSVIATSVIYAVDHVSPPQKPTKGSYADMSIMKLQQEVEKLSQSGNLPFPMGLELIKRWSHAQ